MKKLVIVIWVTLLILIYSILTSCNPSRKAHQFADSHPKEFADFCTTNFPAKDSVFTKDSISFDTLYLESEPKIETTYLSDTVFKTVYFPGTTQFITKTIRKDSIIIRVDRAAVQAKVNQINDLIVVNKDLIGQRDKFKHRSNIWMIIALVLITKAIVTLVWKIYTGKISWIKNIIK